jgi:hypothetical protein
MSRLAVFCLSLPPLIIFFYFLSKIDKRITKWEITHALIVSLLLPNAIGNYFLAKQNMTDSLYWMIIYLVFCNFVSLKLPKDK